MIPKTVKSGGIQKSYKSNRGFVVGDNRIEIRAAALDVLSPDNRMGWGVFLDEFYNMVKLKWNVNLSTQMYQTQMICQ